MKNSAFIYLEARPISTEQEEHIERILQTPYEDLSELVELVEDESTDDREQTDEGLEP